MRDIYENMLDRLGDVTYRSMRHTGRLLNIGIGLAENVAYYTALYSVVDAYAPETAPVWIAYPFVAVGALAFSDSLSRIFFNTSLRNLKSDCPEISKEISQVRLEKIMKKKEKNDSI